MQLLNTYPLTGDCDKKYANVRNFDVTLLNIEKWIINGN